MAAAHSEAAAEKLIGPQCPEALAYLWGWFCDLSNARGGGWGIAPLLWSEVEAWCRITGRSLQPFERRVIRELDREFVKIMAPVKPKS